MMNSSDRIFIDSFEDRFRVLKEDGTPIALYGIGAKTQLLLEHVLGFNFIGLMDRDTVGKVIYGHRVLSNEEAVAAVRHIIIVANLTVTDIIFQRISFLKEQGVRIYRINGSEPANPGDRIGTNQYFDCSIEKLLELFDSYDVISFDLFDTLIMRLVLVPPDIFDLVEAELEYRYGSRFDFKARRIEAERYCYHEIGRHHTFDDIYERLSTLMGMPAEIADNLPEIELDLERRNCVPRVAILRAMQYARYAGKQVWITTDTYFRKKHLQALLSTAGIHWYDALNVSCEMKASKADGDMWRQLKKASAGGEILHVGDNEISDILNAKDAGIGAFETKSAVELLEISSMRYLNRFADRFDNRLVLGQISARFLNDPFVFHNTGGVLGIDSMFDVGFVSFGPLVLIYLLWLIRLSKEHQIEKLLFFARDGYLLLNLYRKIVAATGVSAPEGVYFLTSRRASSVAAMFDKQDIAFVINRMCNVKKTTVEQILNVAFGVNPADNDPFIKKSLYEISKDKVIDYIFRLYGKQILELAKVERESYLSYIKSLGLSAGGKMGCVNYVGRGVTQKCVSRIIGKELHGYYFATESDIGDIMPSLDNICALYGNQAHPYMEKSPFVTKYLFGEVILSSPDEQVVKFDRTGKPIFQDRMGSRDFSTIEECHCGITAFVEEMLITDHNLLERNFDPELAVSLYDLFSSDRCQLSERVKSCFRFNDYYDPVQTSVSLL